MKRFTSYILLFCLVTLMVPREWIHECEHDHHEEVSSSESDTSFDEEPCFSCEFQLDVAPSPLSLSLKLADQEYSRFVETKLNYYSLREFVLFSLRGPPIV